MKVECNLLILFSLALASNCTQGSNRPLAARHVCEVVDHIRDVEGQRVVVQGIFSWEDRHGTAVLMDCRPDQCPDSKARLVVWAAEENRSASDVDDSYDGMMRELAKEHIYKVIATLEGVLRVEDDPFSHPSLKHKITVLYVLSVKSRKPYPLDQKRSNYCD